MAGPMPSEQTIFLEALGIESEAARRQYLDRACAGDGSLRGALDALLTAHFRLAPVAGKGGPGAGVAERPGTVIDGYKLVEQIGEGAPWDISPLPESPPPAGAPQ